MLAVCGGRDRCLVNHIATITEACRLTTPWYLTCFMITEAGSLLTTPCYLTCTMITEVGPLITTPCYLKCTMITEACLLTTPCYLTCTMITEACLLTTPCYLTCTMITEAGSLLTTPCYLTNGLYQVIDGNVFFISSPQSSDVKQEPCGLSGGESNVRL